MPKNSNNKQTKPKPNRKNNRGESVYKQLYLFTLAELAGADPSFMKTSSNKLKAVARGGISKLMRANDVYDLKYDVPMDKKTIKIISLVARDIPYKDAVDLCEALDDMFNDANWATEQKAAGHESFGDNLKDLMTGGWSNAGANLKDLGQDAGTSIKKLLGL